MAWDTVSTDIVTGSPDWARYEDWLHSILGKHSDWTVVAELERYSDLMDEPFTERRATLSYLAGYKEDVLKEVFRFDSWDTQYGREDSPIEQADSGVIPFPSLEEGSAKVFIALSERIGPYPPAWRIWPTFELYFNLKNDESGNLIDPYTGEVVVEVPHPANKGPVRVLTDYLQDYLAARNMVLIRQHDHRRHWQEPIEGISEYEGDQTVHREKWGCYRLDIFNSREDHGSRFSRLVAKDIVTPYERTGTVGEKRRTRMKAEDYPKFITSKGLDGKKERRKPDPDDILHPAYFNPKVLKHYYDEPSRFTVGFPVRGMGSISFLDQWSITIGRNDEGLIVVWLGDFAKEGLPYEEVVHWLTHNVPPKGGMAMDFWNAQLQCEPSKIPSLESRLIDCRHTIVKACESKGKRIYETYKGPDKYIEKTLRIPLFEEHTEFLDTVLLLFKMFIEYLDIRGFRRDLPDKYKKGRDGRKLGPIVMLSNWLQQVIGIPEDIADPVKHSLQNVEKVRNKTGAAHRFSDSSYQEVIQRLGLSGRITAKSLYCSVAEPLADSLEGLCKALGVEDRLWWIKHAND